MISTFASTAALPATGPLALLGPIGAVADMALMAFGNSFEQQMTRYGEARARMTPQQVHEEASRLQAIRLDNSNLARRAVGAHIVRETGAKPVSFLSGLGKVFGQVVPTFGTIASDIAKVIHPASTAAGKAATTAIDAAKSVGTTIAQHPVIAAAAGAAAVASGATMGATAMMGPSHVAGTKGFHMSKPRRGHPQHLVRNRHLNPANGRALRRSLRRIKRFERMARHVLHFTSPHKSHGVARFKFGKKRRAA